MRAVKTAGAKLLRGGAYKPRTSPYDFQGVGAEALPLLQEGGTERTRSACGHRGNEHGRHWSTRLTRSSGKRSQKFPPRLVRNAVSGGIYKQRGFRGIGVERNLRQSPVRSRSVAAGEVPSRNQGLQGQRKYLLMILYFVAVQLAFAALVGLGCGAVLALAGIFAERSQALRPANYETNIVYDVSRVVASVLE